MADPGKELKDAEAEMNMTPMIDVVFLLIIFFMLVSEISNLNMEDIQVPRAMMANIDKENRDADKMVIVSVKRAGSRIGQFEGKALVNGEVAAEAEFSAMVQFPKTDGAEA